ncbi:hypothetical protein ACQBAU_14595 [Propionibacteriaceae bacterium Y2011]|uniref:hypothetical protein n=1 Tax=Microlunatus sp. Y2014 TaxID=3418488 RepID=UPI003B4C6DF5
MSNPYDHNPYAAQQPQQQPYVQASPYGVPMTTTHPQSTIILVLGILSIVGISVVGPVAWVMGNKAIKEIDQNPAAYSDRGTVQAGRIMGIIGSVLLILGVAIMVIYFIFLFLIIGTAATTGY